MSRATNAASGPGCGTTAATRIERRPAGSTRLLLPTLRRLHLAELVHLRAHTRMLGSTVERLKAQNDRLLLEADWADARAEMLQDALDQADDIRLGLTCDGKLLATPADGGTA